MVEGARAAKDASEREERRDTEAHLAKSDDRSGFGTLGDLLKRR